jgi:hypothetical protein
MEFTGSLLGGDPGNHLPRLDGNISQAELLVRQLLHGCVSATLHLTRRALQLVHACFARALRRPLASPVGRCAVREVMSEQMDCPTLSW